MPSFNNVTLIGNLTRDPEVRYTPKGAAVGEISLAINRKYKTDSGDTREEVTYVECTAWGKTAELLGQYVKKGDPLFVSGRLQMDTWEDKQTGQKRSKLKAVIETMQFLKGRDGNSGGGYQQRQQRPQGGQQRSQEPVEDASGAMEDDDIPF
jgi:single-strand DNA-binding protein